MPEAESYLVYLQFREGKMKVWFNFKQSRAESVS